MAKGQIRGNKEARKPKQDKKPAAAAQNVMQIGSNSPMNKQPKK